MHNVFAAKVSARTLSALRDLCRPYADVIVTRRFRVDVRRPNEYLGVLHSITV